MPAKARASTKAFQAARPAQRLDSQPGTAQVLKPATTDLPTRAYTLRRAADCNVPVELPEPAAADMLIGTGTPSMANNYAREPSRLCAWLNGPGQAPLRSSRIQRYLTAVVKGKKTAAPAKKLLAGVQFFTCIANRPSPTKDFIAKRFKGTIARKCDTTVTKKSPIFAADIAAGTAQRARIIAVGGRRPSAAGTNNWGWDPSNAVLAIARERDVRCQDVSSLRLTHLMWTESATAFVPAGAKNDKGSTGLRSERFSDSQGWKITVSESHPGNSTAPARSPRASQPASLPDRRAGRGRPRAGDRLGG